MMATYRHCSFIDCRSMALLFPRLRCNTLQRRG